MYHPRLQGTHYEMGLKYGTLLYRNGIRFENIIQLSEEQQTYGIQSLSAFKLYYPEIVDEIRGMSEGFRYSFERFACFCLISVYLVKFTAVPVFDLKRGTILYSPGTMICFHSSKKRQKAV